MIFKKTELNNIDPVLKKIDFTYPPELIVCLFFLAAAVAAIKLLLPRPTLVVDKPD